MDLDWQWRQSDNLILDVQDADAENRMPHEWRLSSGEEKDETDEPKL